jgi:aquaporin Z
MKKYLGEVLGTFFFVLSIGLAVQFGGEMTALAIGVALMVLVYAGAHISGAHFNPAVTLGLAVSGKHSWSQVIPYWISQLLGAVLAGYLVTWIVGSALTTVALDPEALKVIIVELLFTFVLVWVVLNVAATDNNSGKSFYGLAIGLAVFVGVVSVGSISGGAFNPAVVIWSYFDGLFATNLIWQHLVGQFAGAILAGLAFRSIVYSRD